MTIVFNFLLFHHHHGGHEDGRKHLDPQLNNVVRVGCELNFLLTLFAGIQCEIIFAILECESERFVSKVAAIEKFILAKGFRVDDAFVKQKYFAFVLSPCIRFKNIEVTDLQEFALMPWIYLQNGFQKGSIDMLTLFWIHSLTLLHSTMSFMFIEPFTVSSSRCKRFSAKQQAAICCFTPSSSSRLPSSDIN